LQQKIPPPKILQILITSAPFTLKKVLTKTNKNFSWIIKFHLLKLTPQNSQNTDCYFPRFIRMPQLPKKLFLVKRKNFFIFFFWKENHKQAKRLWWKLWQIIALGIMLMVREFIYSGGSDKYKRNWMWNNNNNNDNNNNNIKWRIAQQKINK